MSRRGKACVNKMSIWQRAVVRRPGKSSSTASGGFDGGFVDEHDGDVIFDAVDAVAIRAFQGFRILAVLEGLFAGGADEDFQKIFGDHGENCT
jgi:hypothetical protein